MPRYECLECGIHANVSSPCLSCGSKRVKVVANSPSDRGITPAVPTLDEERRKARAIAGQLPGANPPEND